MNKRSSFGSKYGFVMTASAAAVGLGNLWRFPYLVAKYGGGVFLIVYILLAFTFGYCMVIAESTLGRMTKSSPVGAFKKFGAGKVLRIGGWINGVIGVFVVSYYSVVGGWVIKYLVEYVRGNSAALATEGGGTENTFFDAFLQDGFQQEMWFVIFVVLVLAIILMGLSKGLERISKIVMPVLIILSIVVVVYSVTRPGAIEGVKYFFIPDFSKFSSMTVVAAMGQIFYSLSIGVGIYFTFGSYLQPDEDIESTTKLVEIFDTGVALLAGLMIIPAVFAFNGGSEKALNAGPSLMFESLPNVFGSMAGGSIIGIVFFLLVLLAAITSAAAMTEAAVATLQDEFNLSRFKSVAIINIAYLIFGSLSALGYNVLDGIKPFGMDILDFMDFATNTVIIPIGAIATVVLILKYVKLDKLEAEIERTSKFRRKKVFHFMMKYLAIALLLVILVSSILNTLGIVEI